MEGMEDQLHVFLLLLTFFQGIQGQVFGPSSVDVAVGDDVPLECTTTATGSFSFSWVDVAAGVVIYTGGNKGPPPGSYDNFLLDEDINAKRSTLTIEDITLQDAGDYRCGVTGQSSVDPATVNVEDEHTFSFNVTNPLVNGTMYDATCEALNGVPAVTITWMLDDDGSFCDDTVETNPSADPDLSSTKSVCTFQADSENNGKTLRCIISGHQVARLNGEQNATLNIHSAPRTGIVTVGFNNPDTGPTVSCEIADENQPNPRIRNYYIYSNDTLIHQSSEGVNSAESDLDIYTEFLCVAGNYLGNTTSQPTRYEPRTTTPLPPTALITSPRPNDGNGTAGLSGTNTLGAGEIAGIVIGVLLLIVIIVVIIYFVLKKGKDRTDGGKHGSSTVGTSNGGEKDKIKPVAAPRDQGSIQHTTDNPGQQEYAMVDRKKPPGGGDMPDTRGPGQESPGMHYADLDLSTNAGHTERQVPQNPDNVVVYSSILV